jgi:cytochrome c-type biogenesis protein CcmF
VAAYFLAPQSAWKVAAGVLGAVWVVAGTVRFVWTRLAGGGRQFTAEMLGMTLAHLGVAVFLVGALLTEGLSQQREVAVRPGQSVTLGVYEFRFQGVERHPGPNFEADRGEVTVFRHGAPLAVMHPEKRAYASGGQVMTEAAIEPGLTRDLYVALGEPLGGGAWALRVHVKPFVRWIWAGALLMMLGGLVTATDRRFRVARVPAVRDEPDPQGQALAGEPAR